MTRSSPIVAVGLTAALLLATASGCGSKGEESSGSDGSSEGSIKGGPGITDKTITLGVLTDLSGVFAPLAQPLTQANQMYWKDQNAKGGVCQRTVKLVIKDHGYDPQKAVVQYRDMSPKIAGLQQLLGSPITAALLPTLKTDHMVSLLSAWPSSLLGNDFVIEIGAPYDIEMINALDYLKEGQDQVGRQDRSRLLRGRVRRERPQGHEVLRIQERDDGRRAEDPADRRGHVRTGRGIQARRGATRSPSRRGRSSSLRWPASPHRKASTSRSSATTRRSTPR